MFLLYLVLEVVHFQVLLISASTIVTIVVSDESDPVYCYDSSHVVEKRSLQNYGGVEKNMLEDAWGPQLVSPDFFQLNFKHNY